MELPQPTEGYKRAWELVLTRPRIRPLSDGRIRRGFGTAGAARISLKITCDRCPTLAALVIDGFHATTFLKV
jgi:hypothetical protein